MKEDKSDKEECHKDSFVKYGGDKLFENLYESVKIISKNAEMPIKRSNYRRRSLSNTGDKVLSIKVANRSEKGLNSYMRLSMTIL
ncbi:hypothetical protein CWI38_1278p0010 [Hamiltosporidium tvaerminnensis]|uniref:Uncharacterized protein n=1 Tax=Hamiltosporidium tvaerminnensis TaxID=1176355 RepID=A0A4Q9LRX2_9MICR|nr:hypothetical protein CWI38_1278p0010 [Hamiltosporidium tvaerminnensis]